MAELDKSPVTLPGKIWQSPLVIFFLVLSVFIWSMPGTVVLEDDGYFILASYFGGYAHPPGYPLHGLLGKAATLFPFGSIASRMHGLSAVLGALACVCLWCLVRQLFGNEYRGHKPAAGAIDRTWITKDQLGMIAALSYAFSAVFWSQAIIAEVYTLNVLLFLLLSCLALELRKHGQNKNLLRMSGFICGLSLSNHWPLFVLSTPLLLAFLWSDRRRFVSYLAVAFPFMILGLSPYVWMVYRSHVIPELNFGGPFSSMADFWRFVSREDFASVDTSPSAGWADKIAFSWFVLQEASRQFSAPVACLVVIGFIRQWRCFPANISIGLFLGFLGNTLLLILLLNFDYDLFHQNTFRVYPIIAYAICAVWLSLGVLYLCESTGKWLINSNPGFIANGIMILLTGIIFITNIPGNYRADDTWAEDYARIILDSLEKHAVLFANADTINGPVGYMNRIEGFRDDVTIYSGFSINITNKLYRLYQYQGIELRRLINAFIEEQQRPVYYTNDFQHDCVSENYGLFFKVNKSNCNDSYKIIIAPRVITYFTSVASGPEPRDPWELMHYRLLREDFCQLIASSMDVSELLSGFTSNDQKFNPYSELTCGHYLGMTSLITAFLRQATPAADMDWTVIEKIFKLAEARRDDEAISKQDYALLDFLRGEMWLSRDQIANARQSYQLAYSAWPHPENPAQARIQNLQ